MHFKLVPQSEYLYIRFLMSINQSALVFRLPEVQNPAHPFKILKL